MQTKIIKIKDENDPRLKEAADVLKADGLVVFPTETVYGLGANALKADAAKKIYAAKGRPSDNPLIVHFDKVEDVEKYAFCEGNNFYKLAAAFMPGPLTVVLPKKTSVPDATTGGLDTVAVRVPENKIARALIKLCGFPIAAPSANISGRPSPTSAEHCIKDLFGRVDVIIESENCEIGLESTVVSLSGNEVVILRPGKITYERLSAVVGEGHVKKGYEKKLSMGEKPLSPGMKYRHYAPKAAMYAVVGEHDRVIEFLRSKQSEKCAVICFTEDEQYFGKSNVVISLGKRDDTEEQAKKLFDILRSFDETQIEEIYTVLPNEDGMGSALRNRMIKACAGNVIEV